MARLGLRETPEFQACLRILFVSMIWNEERSADRGEGMETVKIFTRWGRQELK